MKWCFEAHHAALWCKACICHWLHHLKHSLLLRTLSMHLHVAQDAIRLTVRKDPAGGWTARVGESFGDRGKCEGQNIPPLECVIETKWPGVAVDWNGAEPIL